MFKANIIDTGIGENGFQTQIEFTNGTHSVKRNFKGNNKKDLDNFVKRTLAEMEEAEARLAEIPKGEYVLPVEPEPEPAPEPTPEEIAAQEAARAEMEAETALAQKAAEWEEKLERLRAAKELKQLSDELGLTMDPTNAQAMSDLVTEVETTFKPEFVAKLKK